MSATAIRRASEVKSKPIVIAQGGAGTQHIVPPVAGYRIAVVGLFLLVGSAVSVTLEDTEGDRLTGAMPAAQYGTINLPASGARWCATPVGRGVAIRVSGAVNGGGVLVYQEIP